VNIFMEKNFDVLLLFERKTQENPENITIQ
jgi:hypothetical protein